MRSFHVMTWSDVRKIKKPTWGGRGGDRGLEIHISHIWHPNWTSFALQGFWRGDYGYFIPFGKQKFLEGFYGMWRVLCMRSIFIRFFGNLAPMLGSLNTYTPWWCNVVPSTHMESSIFELFCCNFKVRITKVRTRI
jgi:hypothetical protein